MVVLKKQLSEAVAASILVKILKNLIEFFNVGKSMNDSQLAETVKLILKDYYFLKLEDLKLCFDGMKAGKYIEGGKLFDRLDGQIILLALQAYAEERITIAEQINHEKHKEFKDEKPEQYILEIGKKYFAVEGIYYREVESKDLAHRMDWAEAMRVKRDLIQGDYSETPDAVKVKFADKAEIGLIAYLKREKPELAAEILEATKTEPKRQDAARISIELDDSLSPIQKENKKRALIGLVALTEKEFELSQELLNRTINKH